MKNNYICHMRYLKNSIAYNHEFWDNCVKWWYIQVFYLFFEIFIFQAVRWVKGQKTAQNEKYKLHVSRIISQEQYSIWSWFLVYLCKIMISPGSLSIFFVFWVFIFWAVMGVKGQKIAQNEKEQLHLSHAISQDQCSR